MIGAMPAPVFAFIFNIGPFELLLLGAVSVMLFGGDLPDVARKAGVLVGKLRAVAADLRRQFDESDHVREVKDVAHGVKGDIDDLERSARSTRDLITPPRDDDEGDDARERRRRAFHEEPQGLPAPDDDDEEEEDERD